MLTSAADIFEEFQFNTTKDDATDVGTLSQSSLSIHMFILSIEQQLKLTWEL